jgi:hypothetical protein
MERTAIVIRTKAPVQISEGTFLFYDFVNNCLAKSQIPQTR